MADPRLGAIFHLSDEDNCLPHQLILIPLLTLLSLMMGRYVLRERDGVARIKRHSIIWISYYEVLVKEMIVQWDIL
ncbi:hypothetical protein K7432_006499 [Basidiobolus ranarum]|uniref:Uncharacterized protein n=1 Tax=Basidiobolus ranarum TaxID=34480 RepID=A0ABR2WUS0_9FUNG